jgi:predicted permease
MHPIIQKFVFLSALLGASTFAGYGVRRLRWINEWWAEPIMTWVFLAYSVVGFLSIWILPISVSDFWLPGLTAVHIILMTFLGLAAGRLLFRDRVEAGLFGLASGMGNNGFTMGAFVTYLVFAEKGLNLSSILCLTWTPLTVLFLFPVARRYATQQPAMSMGRIIFRSIFDWRSIGLPLSLAGIALSLARVPYPWPLARWKVMDIVIWVSTAAAYFGIGMRLRLGHVRESAKAIIWLAGMRFVLAGTVGVGLAALTLLTPWGLAGTARDVFLIQSFVPTAVTMVAMANMFGMRPAQASVLFVANTFLYVLLALPAVMWWFWQK